jgi:hypothetical protein
MRHNLASYMSDAMKQLSLMNVTTASERAPVLIGCLIGKPEFRYEVDRVAKCSSGCFECLPLSLALDYAL